LLSAVIIVVLIPISWSVGDALAMPGGGSLSARLAEWARDHYLGWVVTLGEEITYQPPKVGGKPSFALTGPSAAVRNADSTAKHNTKATATFAPPARLRSFAGKPLPGEGAWRVLGTVDGEPAIYGTYLRFSNVYTSYVAGIASMNQSLLKFELRPGTLDPGPGNWKAANYIQPGTRRGLMATFNSGFRINVSGGGFYLNGKTDGTLTPGIASMVYYRDGSIAIGVWDRTVRMTPQVVGVRQNLHLIVINGHVPSSVDYNVETSWGATLGGGYNVWRSGIGITKDGRVIWVYGPALDVRQLASLLRRAGAVTAMQLDINPAWMSYEYYLHSNRANPTPVNLLPDQQEPADRYYYPNSRDFIAVYAR
jgi:Phosphodiester glycosidase